MQLLRIPLHAPPPPAAEFPMSVQLFSVPPYAPPPKLLEEAMLPEIVQLETMLVVSSQKIPPPLLFMSPLVRVKPDRMALLANDTHRALFCPSINVNCGPLTLRKISCLSTTTRLKKKFVVKRFVSTTTTVRPP